MRFRRGQTMYYAFYAKQWEGPVELRGLEDRTCSVVNYVTGKNLGSLSKPYGVRLAMLL